MPDEDDDETSNTKGEINDFASLLAALHTSESDLSSTLIDLAHLDDDPQWELEGDWGITVIVGGMGIAFEYPFTQKHLLDVILGLHERQIEISEAESILQRWLEQVPEAWDESSLPPPGGSLEFDSDDLCICIRNTLPPDEALLTARPDEFVRYEPVETTTASSRVRHAALVIQSTYVTRVDAWTLCGRSGSRRVTRRLDRDPLTNVTCRQCLRRMNAPAHSFIREGARYSYWDGGLFNGSDPGR